MKIFGGILLLFLAVDLCSSTKLTVNVWYPRKEFTRPNSALLYLRGDNIGLDWESGIALQKTNNEDLWTETLNYTAVLKAGERLEMKTLVNDNTWQIGTNSIVYLPVEDATVNIYPFFHSYNGIYNVTKNIQPVTGSIRARPLAIYTPPSYYENTYKTYRNVLIMHDGQNLFNDSTSFAGAWHCQDTVNRLVYEGTMEEIIIVGVYNTQDRMDEYTYSVDPTYGGGNGDAYLDYLQSSVFPYVQQNYRVEMKQPNMGILGSSLGGLISCYAGWTRPDVYAKGGCMSSSFWWNDEDFDNVILNEYSPPDTNVYEVYLDSGDSGAGKDDRDETIRVRDHIAGLGYTEGVNEFYYLDKGGRHSESYWRERFWVPMQDLYRPVAEPVQ